MKYLSYLKWILMLLGAIRFRHFGAFAGFFVGVFLEGMLQKGVKETFRSSESKNVRHYEITPYQKHLCILIAEIMKVDGYIPKEQSYYVLKYFYRQFGKDIGNNLYRYIKEVMPLENDVDATATFLKGHTNRNGRIHIIQFLYGLTLVDERFIEPEQKLLKRIAVRIGMLKEDYDGLVKQFQKKEQKTFYHQYTKNKPLASYYQVLGVKETDGEIEIKKAYRKLVLLYHPDRTKLDAKTAAAKFQEVQEAFDRIKELKGFK